MNQELILTMFQLTKDEWKNLKSQNVISSFRGLRFQFGASNSKGDRIYLPFVFTEGKPDKRSTVANFATV